MQSYTSQPLAKQTQDNPFTNPLFLATLIIPHLETYLAAHNETRFLILEYPPEHLSTVLALQRLVGNDILKVAGVLAAESSNPTSISKTCLPTGKGLHTTNPSISSVTSTRTNATLVSPKLGSKPMETPSFSKANFLLTSAATDSEIAALISTIWKILIDISHFYIPEGAPKESNKGREYILAQKDNPFSNSLTAISGEYAPFATAKLMMGFQVPAAPPEAKEPSTTDTKFRHQLTRSSASIKSSKTANGTYSTRRRLQKLLAQETGGDSDRCSVRPPATHSLYRDMSEEEEDRLCQDERRYMPLYDGKPGSRKGNSRKALAFLGLA